MGYGGGGGGGGGGSGGSGGGSGSSGGSGYRRVGDDRTANLKVNNITNRTGIDGTEVDGIVEVNTTAHFIPPSGTTAERGSRGRGVVAAGVSPGQNNTMQYITIATLGNASDFGDLITASGYKRGSASLTRGIFAGGWEPSAVSNVMEYITVSSTGNAFDFGQCTGGQQDSTGCSDSTRGIIGAGGQVPSGPLTQTIEYVTFSSLGDASAFGDLVRPMFAGAGFGSPTRGIFAGGRDSGNTVLNNSIYHYFNFW